MYKVLVTNDDGINADGIRNLIGALVKFAEVYVVAPAFQQSAKGQSITFLREMEVRGVEIEGTKASFEVEGTPADCVKWAVDHFSKEGIKFDYLLSGINMGGNCGAAAYYSGTISAATEGSLNGIKSIALSVQNHEASHFDYVCGILEQLMKLSEEIPVSSILSVNAPDIPEWKVKGVKIVSAAPFNFGETYVFENPREDTYKMIVEREIPDFSIENDYSVMCDGYVAVSPIAFSLNDFSSLMRLQGLASKDRTTAIFMDAQDKTVNNMNSSESFVNRLRAFAKCLSRLDIPAVVAEDYVSGRTIEDIRINLDRLETVEKDAYNIWRSQDFEKIMSVSNSNTLLLAGTETHLGILQTAEESLKRGYEVIVLEDCCTSVSEHEHRLAIETLRTAGCKISTLESEILKIAEDVNPQTKRSIRKILTEA